MNNLCDYLTYQCVFFVSFSNNLESYNPRFDPMIYNPTYLPWSYVGSRFWQPWFYHLVCPIKSLKVVVPWIIKWQSLPEPFIKLNKDGSSLGNPGKAGASGILHNNSSLWIFGFPLNSGIATNNMAKIWPIQQGLLLAWDIGV